MKKKILALALVVVLAVTAVTGATLAYFTDTDENANVFTMGNIDITLDEASVEREGDEWKTTNERVQENTYEDVYPGAILPKDPTVHNDGSYGAFVRVKITMDFNKLAAMQEDKVLFNGATEYEDLTNIVNIDTENWTFAGRAVDFDARTVTYTYNYNTELAADADTSAVFTEVKVPTFITNEDVADYGLNEFNIDIVAEAIQADSFDGVTAAFAAYDGE